MVDILLDGSSSSITTWASLLLGVVFSEEIGFSLQNVGLNMYGLPSVSAYQFEGFIEFDSKFPQQNVLLIYSYIFCTY
jgi:hypothetical protein